MNEGEMSDAIACSLAWFFPRRQELAFLDYLSLTYSTALAELPVFEKLCLAEALEGDLKGAIGGIIKGWWLADETGCRSVPYRELPRYIDDFNEADRTDRVYYQFPLIKFYREGTGIVFCEKFGPNLICEKTGRVEQSLGGVSIVDVRLVWNVKSLGSDTILPAASTDFDIVQGQAGRTKSCT